MRFNTPLNGIVLERQKIKTPFGVFIFQIFLCVTSLSVVRLIQTNSLPSRRFLVTGMVAQVDEQSECKHKSRVLGIVGDIERVGIRYLEELFV